MPAARDPLPCTGKEGVLLHSEILGPQHGTHSKRIAQEQILTHTHTHTSSHKVPLWYSARFRLL